ncbi:hypothetical protein D0T49_05655 [Paludibacter sp. 221]|uniref:hypothetical protein n=1 Tax=Paludibacter sp. 221 TaxID=2302939 RepID=UPI0013D463D4|nr:hypothetical protein [Paludibacter sp. 221]NDV46527.1 hypothetical protein [Paludibacter sp. 221]
MKKIIILLCCILFLIYCRNTKSNEYSKFHQKLLSILVEVPEQEKNHLVLYLSEGMCADCISKELQNIQEHTEATKNLIIIGAFQNQRHFLSTINIIKSDFTKIHILIDKTNKSDAIYENQELQYLIYDSKNKKIISWFYPISQDKNRTIKYFKELNMK